MNILYVSGMPQPIYALLRGETEIKGMLPYYYPWRILVERGHDVDFVLLSNFNEKPNIKVDWFKEEDIVKNIYAPRKKPGPFRIFRKIRRFLQLLYFTNKAVKEKHYDFIYCMAFEGVAGQIVANIHHIPNGVRSYGDKLYLEIQKKGSWRTAIKHPLEYLCYQLSCDFFLMSEDHKDQRLTFETWQNKKNHNPFYLWPSGIKFKKLNDLSCEIAIPKVPYIFLAARIDPCKRHDRVINVLNEIHKKNKDVHLYFCGADYSEEWKEILYNLIRKLKLDDYVHFLGAVSQDAVKLLSYNAIANILMIDGSSRNNVFYEIFSIGSIVVGLDDGGINDYITDGKSAFLIKDESEAAEKVIYLLDHNDVVLQMRKNAKEEAKRKIMTIEERFGKEVDLIESIVSNHNLHQKI